MKSFIALMMLFGSVSSFACVRDICQGDRVNFGTYVGTAEEVFSNGNVKISVDGYSGYSFRTVGQLGKGVHCNRNICAQDRVNFGTYIGTAEEVFSNGNVKINVDGYSGYSFRTVSQLGAGLHCGEKVCAGSRVNFGTYVGTAEEVFSNGNVKINVDGYSGSSFRQEDQLGVGFRCSGELCVDDRVNFGSYVGTAKEIFSNGNVKIEVDGYSGYSFRTVQELGFGLSCHD